MEPETIRNLILLAAPIFLIQLGVAIYALIDISQRTTTHGPRNMWVILLILSTLSFPIGLILSGIYLAWARHAGDEL
jgi:hypothetical protein